MKIIEIINQYGINIVVASILACIICGIFKVPIAKKIRANCDKNGLNSKIASDRIRNTCNAIVAVLSCAFMCVWHIAVYGVEIMLSPKVYADILTTFTVVKLIYMVYEGVDGASLKKVLHAVVEKIKSRNSYMSTIADQPFSAVEVDIELIKEFFIKTIALPLTDGQTKELEQFINNKNEWRLK